MKSIPKVMQKTSGQRGAALLVSLVMLMLILILAVIGMRVVTLESRITGNSLLNQRMFEVADGTLREGERLIMYHATAMQPCAGSSVVQGGIPCYVSEARTDALGLNTNFGDARAVLQAALNFSDSTNLPALAGYWYPRYIDTVCPKGESATSALNAAVVGCTEYHELNSQAARIVSGAQAEPKDCGPYALCLRSTINMFIK